MPAPIADLRQQLLDSPKFLEWRPAPDNFHQLCDLADEKHFTPTQIAEMWGVSAQTIRNIFESEPGVLRIGGSNGKKRTYVSIRIPESVVERVHRRLSAIP